MSATTPWEEMGIDQEEYEMDRQVWEAQAPQMLLALECGYLDNFIGQFVIACHNRSGEIGPKKISRPQSRPTVTVDPTRGPVLTVDDETEDFDPVPAVTPVADPGIPQNWAMNPQDDSRAQYHGYLPASNGKLYYKKQLGGKYFQLSNRTLNQRAGVGTLMQVAEVNKTRAVCVVRDASKATYSSGRFVNGYRISVPLAAVLEDVLTYDAKYGIKTKFNHQS